MEVLLVKDVQGIGQKNQLLTVGDGFALNNLLPKGCAVVATESVKTKFATEIAEREAAKTKSTMKASSAISAIDGKQLALTAKATKTGKLYAAITEEKVVALIDEQLNVAITPEMVVLAEQVKALGEFTITIKADPDTATCTLTITQEKSTS
jgi:large subunit ribosomal protein L9